MKEIVGIGDLVEDTGESVRTLQFWCDMGILRPNPVTRRKGRGHFREFPASAPMYGERTWALLASALKKTHIPFADIKDFIDWFRGVHDAQEEPPCGWSKYMNMTPVGRALLGKYEVVVLFIDDHGKIGWASLLQANSLDELKKPEIWPVMINGEMKDIEEWGKVSVEFPVNVIAKQWSIVLNLSAALTPLVEPKQG
ncbi:MerR family transcriptional regulator [Methylocapsa aurea]|uniref:helix-turn-helix domain-containing protein n=1 Tax=Methylocapsa aurea TaxID=663610 RepID=UPI0012EC9981|nr:MerR family transcriptional regulator [Methylocapsa aurea]